MPTNLTHQPETTNQLERQLAGKSYQLKNQQPNQPNHPSQNLTEKLKIFKEKLQTPTNPTNQPETTNQLGRQLTGKNYQLKKTNNPTNQLKTQLRN